ncbi:MAG: diacylglycerol kinase family protein [Pseudomonadota bacterium]|nr:diacylglycerol kinase family protein [Pseudomonadota bacterium]
MWLLVSNPTARSGLAANRLEGAVALLAAHGVEVAVLATLPHGGTVGAVAAALQSGAASGSPYRGVIAMGGDGTFHEVANGLLRSGVRADGDVIPLALLPAGTGNNQARALGLPLEDLEAAVARIAAGNTTPMDGARVTAWDEHGALLGEAWAFDSVGFGFSARALRYRFEDKAEVEQMPLWRAIYRDELVYAGALVRALVGSSFEDHRFDAQVTTVHGTRLYEDLHDLVVNNTRFYARAWVLDPTSRHDDGEMELVAIRGLDEWAERALVDLDGSPFRDWFDAAPALLRAAWFDLELRERPAGPPIPAQVDGEPWPAVRRVRIEVAQGAIRVVV